MVQYTIDRQNVPPLPRNFTAFFTKKCHNAAELPAERAMERYCASNVSGPVSGAQ